MAKAAKYIVVLGIALVAVSAAAGAVAARRYGSLAYEASAVAATLNWVAGSAALITISLCRNPQSRIQGALLAMSARMALPLVALAFLSRSQHPLAAAGLGGLIVVHYLAGLAIETLMTLRLVAASKSTASSSGMSLTAET